MPAPAPGGLRLDSTRIRKLDGTRRLTGREKTPHPALPLLRDRHPLPNGEGRYPMCFRRQPSPRGEGARRRRAGEGLLGRSSKPRVKQLSAALFRSWAGLVEATSAQRIGTERSLSVSEFGFKMVGACARRSFPGTTPRTITAASG